MKPLRLYLLGALFLFLVMFFIYWRDMPDGKLHLSFLDVGQGDSILINSPAGQQILIDGGPPKMDVLEELGQTMPFFDHKIELIILTHPDNDHLSGLVEVLKRYKVEKVLLTGIDVQNPFYEEFFKIIQEKNIPVEIAEDNDDFYFENDLFIDILNPIQNLIGQKVKETNASSIVFKLKFNDFSVLFTGDLETAGEKELLKENLDLHSDLLKIGHHGSKYSTSEEFLHAVHPEYAVIEVGQDNSFGHPHPEVLERLYRNNIQIFRTDWMGRIEMAVDEEGKIGINKEKK